MTEILFCAKNRLEFTAQAIKSLLRNTNWAKVSRLVVYDDGSVDGTFEHLRRSLPWFPVEYELRESSLGSPVAITNDFLAQTRASMFAKIDNDALLPPGWLDISLSVFKRQPELECLGLEFWNLDGEEPHRGEATDSTGGLFVARTSSFSSPIPQDGKLGGLQIYQQRRKMRCAWIAPSIKVVLLDRIPVSPFREWSAKYLLKGWQRKWKDYLPSESHLWDWWTLDHAKKTIR